MFVAKNVQYQQAGKVVMVFIGVNKLRERVKIRPRGYKICFMLNSAEHEMFSANKYENANSWHFPIYLQRKFQA